MMLLGFAHVLLEEDLVDWDFVRDWVDWRGFQRGQGQTPDIAVDADHRRQTG